jgi:two-component system, NarL family, response regulator DesR
VITGAMRCAAVRRFRLLLAEDQHVVRGAPAALLDLQEDLTVVARAATGDDAVSEALVYLPAVAVLDIDIDIDMPGRLDGLAAAATIKERLSGCRNLILTGNGRPGLRRRALEAKVDGFPLKTAPPAEELAAASREVAGGGRVLDPALAVTAWDLADNPLTPRERDVPRELAGGAEPPEIAAKCSRRPGRSGTC